MIPKHAGTLIFLIVVAVFAFAMSAKPRSANSSPQTKSGKCDKVCLQAKVDRYLMLMGEFEKDEALAASLQQLRTGGAPLVRVVEATYDSWSRSDNTLKGNARPAEMRWRAVHLLGSLGSQEATTFLYQLAKRPLPDPRAGELEFKDEYRLRLRAIAGLEKLKAVAELKDLHELGGLLRNPTAVSLYELGVNVGGGRKVEAQEALAEDTADSRDSHPGKGRPPQLTKPGREKIYPVRRPDTPSLHRQPKGA